MPNELDAAIYRVMLAAVERERDGLREENACLHSLRESGRRFRHAALDNCAALRAECDALKARVGEMEGALEPLVKLAWLWDPSEDMEPETIWDECPITFGDLRRAALAAGPAEERRRADEAL